MDTENCSGEYKPVSRIFPAPFSFPHSWGVGFSLSSGSIVNALLPFMVKIVEVNAQPWMCILNPWAYAVYFSEARR